jgi:hypothetical protein
MASRRKFIVGLGALSAGAASAVGTGALTASSQPRDANINVVNDAQGVIALRDDTSGDFVSQQDGALTIDLTAAGAVQGGNTYTSDNTAEGVAVDSVYQFGQIQSGEYSDAIETDDFSYTTDASGDWDPAFSIRNLSGQSRDVTLEYSASGDPGGSEIFFQVLSSKYNGGATDGLSTFTIDSGTQTASVTQGDAFGNQLRSGSELLVSFVVNTKGGSPSDNLSGTLTVSSDEV